MVRAGRRVAPPLTLHPEFERRRQHVCTTYGLSITDLWRACRVGSYRHFWSALNGQASASSTTLCALATIGALLGCAPDEIVVGQSLPVPADLVTAALRQLEHVRPTPHVFNFVDRRIGEVASVQSCPN